ncbi:BCS1 N terminal-domain-containing protein [Plectosphaerella cucumerina]|uniref:BCS1 N terminal-domain-containing protein n=1 Tax=Plectosphaerella cucumerina TaxID=40658 RepID=A0A8K0X800_9PEZI|nr:BCS1 N terminal-domain-containing protein [Plectosphaerella cucumerina]
MEQERDKAHTDPVAIPTTGALHSVLDLFFPGFGVFAESARQHWGFDLGQYVHIALAVAIAFYAWSLVRDVLLGSLKTIFFSTAAIPPDDEIYNVVISWIAAQPTATNSRRFFVNLNLATKPWSPWMYHGHDEQDDPADNTLSYTPSYGTHLLWFRGRPVLLNRSKGEPLTGIGGTTKRDDISLSCFGFSADTLKKLLETAQADHLRKDHDKTVIYRGHMGVNTGANWSRATSRLSRPFDTIYTRAGLKETLVNDVKDYLSAETKAWYANCGIPWRRGYLLTGPPGTGKSSISFALAGHFGLKIYTVSLSSPGATEENLSMLFEQLPQSCIVLFEDVDAAGLTRTRAASSKDVPSRARRSRGPSSRPGLSLSGLLNLLDGVASQEGRILIMTTNHAEDLDKALIRPGRVDMTLHFGLADANMAGAIFKGVFAHLHRLHSATADDIDDDETGRKRQAETVKAKIEGMASDFASRIPPAEFSPAEIQGYLIRHRKEPEAALDGAHDWISEARKRRKEEAEELLRAGADGGESADKGAEEGEEATNDSESE